MANSVDARRHRDTAPATSGESAEVGLWVGAEAAGSVSLSECVRHALSEYFRTLDGEPCQDLYKLALGQFERPLFEVVMREVRGNHTRAAKMLGMSRATLRGRLEKYGLE